MALLLRRDFLKARAAHGHIPDRQHALPGRPALRSELLGLRPRPQQTLHCISAGPHIVLCEIAADRLKRELTLRVYVRDLTLRRSLRVGELH